MGAIREQAGGRVHIQVEDLSLEVGLGDVRQAVAVPVGHIDTHAGLRRARLRQSHAGEGGALREAAPAVADEQHAGPHVHGHVDVHVPVLFDVEKHHVVAVARRDISDAGRAGDIDVGAVPAVPIEVVGSHR